MKKTEITVSMPMTSYEELMNYKTKYENLIYEIQNCFNTQNFNTQNIIDFDINKILNISKLYLPIKYHNGNFNKIT